MSSESPPPKGRDGEQSESAFPSPPLSYDPVTGLPWSSNLLPSAVTLARAAHETQVVYVQLNGLQEVALAYGDRVAHLLLRQLVRRLRSLLGSQDLMGRHATAGLFIISARVSTELQNLITSIPRQVRAVAILTGGRPLPEARIGVVIVPQVAGERDALSAIEAAVAKAQEAVPQPQGSEGPPAPGVVKSVLPQEESIAPVGPSDMPPSPRPSGQPQSRPPAVRATSAPTIGEPAVFIRRIAIAMEGAEATAMITLTSGTREAEAEVSGVNTPRDRLTLVGEVTAIATLMLLPQKHTVRRVSVNELSQENNRFISAVVEISGPSGTEQMSATVPIQGTTYSTVARAVVQAMEARVREVLGMPIP